MEIRSPHFTVLSNAGEKEGRRVAAQFENVRALFHAEFPKLRVDPAKPTIIFALKNEDSLKLFLPNYGQNKNAPRLAGLYAPTADRNFALVRTDVSGSGANVYHSLYHEYTHAFLRMNYRGLPVWLEEGLAEFYGNTVFEDKRASFGMLDMGQLRILQETQLIPVATLVTVDYTSPLYKTREHNGIFYAESWAMVHYFSLAPEVREQRLLDKFLAALQATDDPVEAANQSFGDLKKLAGKLEEYARQVAFSYQRIPVQSGASEKDFSARTLAPAEALTAQADFLLRRGGPAQALNVLHEAIATDPKLAAAHDGMGFYHYIHSDNENAQKEFDEALKLDSNDATAYYYQAHILLRKSGYTKETTPLIRADLEKVISLQPDFAPAHAFLCIAYTEGPETKPKSLEEANRAIELEPGNMAYFIDFGKALLANGRKDDAKSIADRAQKIASTPRDRNMATSFAKRVASQGTAANEKSVKEQTETANPNASEEDSSLATVSQMATAEGQISELICGRPPEVLLTLATSTEQMLLHVKDISKIELQIAGQESSGPALPCAQWRDRKARIAFRSTPEGPAHGEIQKIEFF